VNQRLEAKMCEAFNVVLATDRFVAAPSSALIPAGEYVPTADQRIVTYGVPWSHYEAHLALRGDASVPRMAYLEGTLEFMQNKQLPDVAIEVVWTSGGIDKLEI
jgi:hypothetical protein